VRPEIQHAAVDLAFGFALATLNAIDKFRSQA
jgi:hypothetical protein